ncbi:MAG: 4-hydroxythreonine-4-phosphate dehydrogenase PdxA [Planctomycetes bacterium]|nr:4-hydroxythreonine-4-phosphate dehydrogenase PdxA [Planctomycetota bacterium]
MARARARAFADRRRDPEARHVRRRLPTIAISLGDPAGIGAEVTVKALVSRKVAGRARFVILGDRRVVDDALRIAHIRALPASASVVDFRNADPATIPRGRPSAAAGRASVAYIERGVRMCQRGDSDAIVTAPIHKKAIELAGFAWEGHTEMLRDFCRVKRTVLMLAGGPLRVAFVTSHVAIRKLAPLVTRERVLETIEIVARDVERLFGVRGPAIAVCGLNPHAGDEGRFGREDSTEIAPAVADARALGIDCTGPYPADTLFPKAASGGAYDAVIAIYHDQGTVPVKLLSFGHGINVTLGLPIVRTSVDHGTAFDIAGRGVADAGSMIAALSAALEFAARRKPRAARSTTSRRTTPGSAR